MTFVKPAEFITCTVHFGKARPDDEVSWILWKDQVMSTSKVFNVQSQVST